MGDAVVSTTGERTSKRKRYRLHPACVLFPEMTADELRDLANDIAANGLLNPIVLLNGLILDGRNRLAACKTAGVEPRFVDWNGRGSAFEWAISQNVMRRHLTASQRAVVALDLLSHLEIEAKDRQKLSRGRAQKVAKQFATSSRGKASVIAARLTRSNARYVEALKAIHKRAPDLIDHVRKGNVSVSDARCISKLKDAERQFVLAEPLQDLPRYRLLELIKQAQRASLRKRCDDVEASGAKAGSHNIFVGDMTELAHLVEDDSADLFVADPPWNKPELYERLSQLASQKLRPGGLCLAYAGHLQLPTVLSAMSKHLTYWWTFAIVFQSQSRVVYSRQIQNRWRSVVAFCKPPIRPAADWLRDVVDGGGRSKRHHDWGQAAAEVEYFIQRLTVPGAFVVDPFCGGGTVPLACMRLGRRFIATEKDSETARIAKLRLHEFELSK